MKVICWSRSFALTISDKNLICPRLKAIFRHVPYSMKMLHTATFCMGELYAKIWLPKGWLSRGFQKNVLEKVIREQVGERPDLISKLTPKYEVGCKRIMLSSNFLPMFVQVCLPCSNHGFNTQTDRQTERHRHTHTLTRWRCILGLN